MSVDLPWNGQVARPASGQAAVSMSDRPVSDIQTLQNRFGLGRGSLIATPTGDVALDALSPGDPVVTACGDQARILHARAWEGTGALNQAAVSISAGLLRNSSSLYLAPMQPIVLTGHEVELHFGCDAAWCRAMDLVICGSARIEPGEARFIQLTLDRDGQILGGGLALQTSILCGTAKALQNHHIRSGHASWLRLTVKELRLIIALYARRGHRPVTGGQARRAYR